MKVVTQLIRHFWQRGVLTGEEADYLVQHGFVRDEDLPGYTSADDSVASGLSSLFTEPVGPLDDLEFHEQQLVNKSGRGRRGGRPRGKVLETKDLQQRLKQEFHRRARWLRSLKLLAERFEPCRNWRSASVTLRQATAKRFADELACALREDRGLFRKLWRAVDIEPFHKVMEAREMRGPAAQGFSALLMAGGPAELGKYGWLLKHDEMQAVINLRVVHRQLLNGMKQLYRRHARLLKHVLDAGCDAVPFWALVLLHNACHKQSANRGPATREYQLNEQPWYNTWQQAWTKALVMDRKRVTSLLVDCYGDQRHRQKRPKDALERPLYCPVGWHAPNED